MTALQPPDPKALVAAAQQLDRTWDQWIEADDDARFPAVEEAVASLRRALAGTRRMRLSKDQYGFWRARCTGCRWPGSPWDGDPPGDLRQRNGRHQAIDEFAAHICGQAGDDQ